MSKSFDIVINEERINKKKIFVVYCLNLGITGQGKTVEVAMGNIEDAIRLYLEENPGDMPNSEDLMPPMATRIFI
ncbi:MAG TPA: type II toxin-antitoxin system HicB family antitoxin [Candidatus Nanoarchaeia archaeon]|nr:type II toxin-antitoxin system HicB family antitoxin [Candidatus Nanoarchaeia archaeon]